MPLTAQPPHRPNGRPARLLDQRGADHAVGGTGVVLHLGGGHERTAVEPSNTSGFSGCAAPRTRQRCSPQAPTQPPRCSRTSVIRGSAPSSVASSGLNTIPVPGIPPDAGASRGRDVDGHEQSSPPGPQSGIDDEHVKRAPPPGAEHEQRPLNFSSSTLRGGRPGVGRRGGRPQLRVGSSRPAVSRTPTEPTASAG